MRSLFKKSILKQVNGDVKLAEKLTPKYEIGCKRLLGMNDFVPMFANKPNAHLITEGKALKRTGPLSSGNWNYRGSPTCTVSTMAIWVVEFSNGGYKIRKIFAKESTYSKEIIEF